MTTALKDMSVTEAVNKAFEVMAYGEYVRAQTSNVSWRLPYKGTFEEYMKENYYADFAEQYGDHEDFSFDTDYFWGESHYGSNEGTQDNWTAKVEASYGGEGQGDEYWLVISVSDGETTRYFRRDGWYASYDGGYLDGESYEVKPQEKMITVYE